MSKFLYPIKNLKIETWLKYWLLNKGGKAPSGVLSEIITGASPLTLENSLRKKFNIFNIGGNTKQQSYTGKNILDATQQSYTLPANTTKYQTIHNIKPYLEADTKYYISYNIDNASTSNTRSTPRLYYNNTQYVQAAVANYNLTAGRKVWEFTPSETGSYDVQYWLQGSNVDVTVSDFMISTSSDTTYEPYVGGQASPSPLFPQPVENVSGEVEVKVENKNLCTSATKQDNNNLRFYIDKDNIQKTFELSFTPNVALSSNSLYLILNGTSVGIVATISATANTKTSQSITLSNANYEALKNSQTAYILLYKNNAGFTAPADAQIENGSTPTDYEPHEEQTATLSLPEGMEMCKIGDYADSFVYQGGKWYKNKNIGKVILDGSGSFTVASLSETVSRFNKSITDLNSIAYTAGNTDGYCNYFKYLMQYSGNLEVQRVYTGLNNVYIITSVATTVEDMKTWLNEHNLIIYYRLKEPVLEEITDTTLIEQLDNLKNLYSYKGTTYISSSNEVSPVFEVQYYMEGEE